MDSSLALSPPPPSSWPRMRSDIENPFQNAPGPFIYALPNLSGVSLLSVCPDSFADCSLASPASPASPDRDHHHRHRHHCHPSCNHDRYGHRSCSHCHRRQHHEPLVLPPPTEAGELEEADADLLLSSFRAPPAGTGGHPVLGENGFDNSDGTTVGWSSLTEGELSETRGEQPRRSGSSATTRSSHTPSSTAASECSEEQDSPEKREGRKGRREEKGSTVTGPRRARGRGRGKRHEQTRRTASEHGGRVMGPRVMGPRVMGITRTMPDPWMFQYHPLFSGPNYRALPGNFSSPAWYWPPAPPPVPGFVGLPWW
ncbi:hypothetical protein F5148DRAFT_1240860 [Russula earlei]|uniref:Uncharacterized protein n=1 Tax=Russula earlei TaxID=71964 RepID=A0ACC0TVS5_9AGAM|nr:hypothetical protein F5148DRAFT_1240860 [Russula earlei]